MYLCVCWGGGWVIQTIAHYHSLAGKANNCLKSELPPSQKFFEVLLSWSLSPPFDFLLLLLCMCLFAGLLLHPRCRFFRLALSEVMWFCKSNDLVPTRWRYPSLCSLRIRSCAGLTKVLHCLLLLIVLSIAPNWNACCCNRLHAAGSYHLGPWIVFSLGEKFNG